MPNRDVIVRDSDGKTVDTGVEEAEHADLTANAKRAILVDESGNPINLANPLPVDTELTLDGNVIIDNVSVFATDIADSSTNSFALVDESGHLHINQTALDSANNSTTTPLGIGGVFTGTADDMLHYAAATIAIFTDEASATDGFSIQWSSDGTNWDHTEEYTIPASSAGKGFFTQAMKEGRYFRIVYTNGGTAQTVFRIQVICSPIPSLSEVQPLSLNVIDDNDAQLVRAVLAAQIPDLTYTNINATAGGNLKVSVEEFDPAVFGQEVMANSLPVAIASDQSPVPTEPGVIDGRNFAYEDTSFVTGDSPATHDVNTDLGRNAVDGYITNDGPGNILVEISDDGASYGTQFTMKVEDTLDLRNINVDSIRITWVTDSAYRILVV